MITSTQDSFDILRTREETVSLKIVDKIWDLNRGITTSNAVENSNFDKILSGKLAFRLIACSLKLHLFVQDRSQE